MEVQDSINLMRIGFAAKIRQCSSVTQKGRIRVVLLVLLISGAAIYLANREPSYNGRALSSWLKELNSDDDDHSQAREAIRQIGTNGLPYILNELRHKDSTGKRKLMEWNNRLESRLEHNLLKLTPAEHRRAAASEAIRALGSNAVSAIPEIRRNLTDPELANQSAEALALIGQPAMATIQGLATSNNSSERWACAYALMLFTNTNEVGPTLQALADDTQPEVRMMVAHNLGHLAYAPETSVPILANLLSDTNRSVQAAACRGLVGFGTNAAAIAPALSNIFASAGLMDSSLRNAAGLALQRTGPSSIPIFLKLLSHPDGQIRADAVRHLGSFHDEATNHVAEILSLLRDPDRRVRIFTLGSLRVVHVAPTQVMPSIVEAFKLEEDPVMREHYMTTFEQSGKAATNALPMLTELARHAEGEPRTELLLTIAAIDEDAAKKLGAETWLLDIARAHRQQREGGTNQPGIKPPQPFLDPRPPP